MNKIKQYIYELLDEYEDKANNIVNELEIARTKISKKKNSTNEAYILLGKLSAYNEIRFKLLKIIASRNGI